MNNCHCAMIYSDYSYLCLFGAQLLARINVRFFFPRYIFFYTKLDGIPLSEPSFVPRFSVKSLTHYRSIFALKWGKMYDKVAKSFLVTHFVL